MNLSFSRYVLMFSTCFFGFSLLVFGQGMTKTNRGIVGKEHYVMSNGLKVYLWEKYSKALDKTFRQNGKIVLLVHGSTYSGRPDFDLQIRDYSLMDFLAKNGYDVWAIDVHGYGRSDKTDKDWSDTESAVLDIDAVVNYIVANSLVKKVSILGWSWGTQTAGLYTMQNPERVGKLILYAMMWKGTPRLKDRPVPIEHYRINAEVTARSDFIEGQYETDVVDKYVKEALATNPKSPNGGRIDVITKLPMLQPERIKVPTLIIRPEKDYASTENETLEFFGKLGTNDKSLVALPNGGHSLLLEKSHDKFQNAVLSFLNQP